MKDNVKINWSFWLSLMAFVISLVALAVFICKVEPYSVVTIDTYIGVIAGFIGISVTLVIGFQIYSFISIKDKIKEMSTIKKDLLDTKDNLSLLEKKLLNTKDNLTQLENELKGMIYYSESIIKGDQEKNGEAFEKLHYAILHFADIDSKKEELLLYIKLLNVYANNISESDFHEPKDYNISVMESLSINTHLKMKHRKYYWVIKDEYEKIYNELMSKLSYFKIRNLM